MTGAFAEGSPALRNYVADVAQLVEHFLGKEEVTGSIPVISSTEILIWYRLPLTRWEGEMPDNI
jgi:hypothetical protein